MLVALADVTPQDRARVGGKGLALARLARAELPVPPGFVIPAEVFANALVDGGLSELVSAVAHGDLALADELAAAIRALPIPPALERDIHDAARRLGARVAVRSSALDEDGRKRSFAGQHTTRLSVPADAVVDAVREVWASLYSAAGLAYRGGHGPEAGAMAVVVQAMVEPRASGVLFTVNPHNGSWREIVIEAVWGLGEGLVSGRIAPHWWIVRRPRRLPGPLGALLSRVRLNIVQEDQPSIGVRFVAAPDGGVREEPVPAGLRGKRILDRDAVMRLCRLALKVEALAGEPQDIEWAIGADGRPVLLQARPITAAGPARARDDVLWTRRFIGERWAEPATPLGWSVLAPIFEHFIAYPDTSLRHLGGAPAVRLYRSRPYINATVFRHLLFKLPGAPAPSFMLEMIPPEEESAFQRRFARLPGFSVYGSIFRETFRERRWRRFRWNPLTNPTRWEEFRARLERELPSISRLPVSETDGLRLAERQIALVRDYVAVHVTSLLFANIAYQIVDGLLATRLPEDAPRLLEALATSPAGNQTLATNEALWELARLATDRDLDDLTAKRPLAEGPFVVALRAFLSIYGHRSANSWEIFSPRWGDHPELLVPMLRSHRASTAEAPLERARRQQEAYERAHAELLAELPKGLDRRFVLDVIERTRTYLLLRENQRFWFDQLLRALQRNLVAIGDKLAARGLLDQGEDVAFLTREELAGLVDGTLAEAPAREWIARRREQRDVDAQIEPPVFLRGDEGVPDVAGGLRLQGTGISPGRASGRVRILRSPAEAHRLGPGEILVTHAVDPGWTPLFANAGAIVLEIGSRLSHGAVVAREYGIPAVANLGGVARRLVDGQEITVDGTRGIVWIHP